MARRGGGGGGGMLAELVADTPPITRAYLAAVGAVAVVEYLEAVSPYDLALLWPGVMQGQASAYDIVRPGRACGWLSACRWTAAARGLL
jgi:hypothetical protein